MTGRDTSVYTTMPTLAGATEFLYGDISNLIFWVDPGLLEAAKSSFTIFTDEQKETNIIAKEF